MRKIFLFIILFFCFSRIYTQNFSGKILDEQTQQPLSFANVVLLQKSDSTFVAGTVTDTLGNFSIIAARNNYILKVSFLGYETKFLELNSENAGTILLVPDTKTLEGITVTASRPIYKMENGGISTDIQNSRLKDIGTASEVLGQLPLVNKTGSGYEVFGKGEPLIYVNNRLLRDKSELERINSEQIKKVTVITNPSSEYDATVKSVIKIETIKRQGDGLSGSVIAGGNTKQFKTFGTSEAILLNYRTLKLDIFGAVGYGNSLDFTNGSGYYILNQQDRVFLSKSDNSYRTYKYIGYYVQTGAVYTLNSDNEIGIMYDFTKIPNYTQIQKSDESIFINDTLQKQYHSEQNMPEKSQTNYLNAYYNGKIAHWLSAKLNIDYANGDNTEGQTYKDISENVVTTGNRNYDLFAAKLVFNTPFGKDNLSYGAEYSYTNNRQNFKIVQSNDTSDILEPNNNTAKQNLFAAFATYSKNIGKFSFDLGLRYENVDFQYFVDKIKEDETSKTYNNLFPNINITYSDNLDLTVGFNRSISRPSYFQLRNSVRYNNPFWYEIGNPYLKPTYDNCFSSSVKWKNFMFSANYDIYEDYTFLISKLYQQDIVLSKFENHIKNVQNLSLSAFYQATVKIWQPSVELNFSKQFIEYNKETFNIPMYYVKFKNNFQFNKTFQIGLETNYSSCGNGDFEYIYDRFRVNISLIKTFFNDKLRINFYGNDIFNTDRQKSYSNVNNIYTASENDFLCNPQLILRLTYNFNATQNKYKGERASEELNRL